MEVKKCISCGRELELSNFQSWVRKDGSIGHLKQCLKCQHAKAYRRYADKHRRPRYEVSEFKDSELLEELCRRGYMLVKSAPKNGELNY